MAEKLKEKIANVAEGCIITAMIVPLFLGYALVVAPALYLLYREPKVRQQPIIPRLTRRGKIRFLEKQLKRADKAIGRRSIYYFSFNDRFKPDFNDILSEEREVMQKLIPLYQTAGRKEDAEKLNSYLNKS